MKIIVQIYEIQTPEEAEILVEIGVDHIGSVLTSGENWKQVQVKNTIDLVKKTNSKTSLIPLFSTPDTIFRVLDYYRPDIIHFCESLADRKGIFPICKDLIHLQEHVKEKFPGVKIMRSIPIARPGLGNRIPSLEIARMFEPVSDYFLTDTLILPEESAESSSDHQPVSGFVGITGKICDQNIAAELVKASSIPVILAGGITPDNVSQAVRRIKPAGVDSCTGTNALDNDGNPIRFKKDMEKVRRFIDEVNSCSQ